jgi:hypothetical protein
MKAIHNQKMQSILLDALMSGNGNQLQKEVWQVTQSMFRERNDAPPDDVPTFVREILAWSPGISTELRNAIQDIIDSERLLVTINSIFHYCRRKNGTDFADILKEIEGINFGFLPEQVPDSEFPRRDRLISILAALHERDLARVLNETLDLNKAVMQERGGAPWVELESGKTVRVRVKSESSVLKNQEELETSWDYDYFLGSFLGIARQQLVNI